MRPLLVLIVLAFAAACSHPSTAPAASHVGSTWKGPEILAQVPADTPYFFGALEVWPPALRDLIVRQTAPQVRKGLQKLAQGEGHGAKAAGVLLHALEGVDDAHWIEGLGLSSETRFVLYGLSVWPVMRAEVKDPARVQSILDQLIAGSETPVERRPVGSHTAIVFPSPKVAGVVIVLDKEIVAALVPSDKLAAVMPVLAGTEKPASSLRDAPMLPRLLAKHRLAPAMLVYVDFERGLDAATGHGKGQYDSLDTMFAGLLTPQCAADVARIVSVAPRAVVGYRTLDDHGFTATMAIESPSWLVASLAKLHAPMPEMPLAGKPLFALGAAINVDAALAWLKDATSQLRAAPFRCDAFGELNQGIDELASSLNKPLPPMAQGLRGFEMVVDDASISPPSGTGYVMVAGDHIADLIHAALAQLPMMAALQIPTTGSPIALPVDQLGIPGITSAHLALRATKAALAIGAGSEKRVADRIATPDAHAPLMKVYYDLPRIRQRFPTFLGEDYQGLEDGAVLSLDVGEEGISIDMVGTWAHGR